MSRRQSVRQLTRKGSIAKLERSLSAGKLKLPRRDTKPDVLRQISAKSLTHSKLSVNIEGQLIQEESAQEGSVKMSVMVTYAKAMGLPVVMLSFLALVAQQGFNIYSNFWITFWTEDTYLKNASLIDTTKYTETKNYYLGIYALLGILQGVTLFMFSIIVFTRFVSATGKLHDKSLGCIFRSPMAFFDTTPVGRIMNRFSSDLDVIDDRFPRTFRVLATMTCILIGTVIVITVTTPISAVIIIPLIILYIVMIKIYLPSARQLKRIESVTRSPVYNHFSETISGSSIIRAYRSTDRFIEEVYKRLDVNSTFYFAANTGMGWIAIIIETLGNLILLAVALFGVLSDVSGADIGLALTYAFQIIIAMNIVVRGVTEMQMNVVSIERVEEYMDLPPEADWVYRERPPISWPVKGTIQFNNYKTRYRPGLELVLKGINCHIRNGERVGIVGRTGAGKSSLTQALFRLIEPAEGFISLDEITTTAIGLHDLRRKITILPQDPVLFSDTLRVNLDPLGKFSDTEIWRALECAHLKQFAMNQNGQLMSELGEGGNNLSVGQRQLVCLARTLLHKTNILILDEATAAVDMETDDLIQQTIGEQFADCTILSIAHRLNTVMEYDRIMVMDKGLIAEFDTPENLLSNKDGVFYSMAKDAGLV